MRIAGKILRIIVIIGFALTLLGYIFGMMFQGSESINSSTLPVLAFWALLAGIAVYYEKKANKKKVNNEKE